MQLYLMLIGMVMAGISLAFTILETFPLINACKRESAWIKEFMETHSFWFTQSKIHWLIIPKGITFNLMGYSYIIVLSVFNSLKCIKLAIPPLIDFGALAFLGMFINTGDGYASGITAYFISNVISVVIYYHTHWKQKKSWKGEPVAA